MSKGMSFVLLLAVVGCECNAPPDTLDPQNSATDRPEDWRLLDAAIGDLLVRPDLGHARDFYGSGGTLVLFDAETFPTGYTPSVPEFKLERRDRNTKAPREAPRVLTIDLRWFRGRPMLPEIPPLLTNEAYRDHYKDWDGILLCVFNGGGSGGGAIPIGGCSVRYDVIQKAGELSVEYMGAEAR